MELLKDRKVAELAYSLNLFDLEELLDVAIEQIPKIIVAHRVSIYLMDKEEIYLESKRHSSKRLQEHLAEKVAINSEASLIPQVLFKKRPLLIANVAEYIIKNNLPIKLSKRQRYTSGSCMLVPVAVQLPHEEKMIGVINFSEKADFTPFSKIDLELATHVGEILGAALHNCTVVEKKLGGKQKQLMNELDEVKQAYAQKEINLDEAKKRQTQMQSESPEIANYDLNVLYSPMETIGGDFYDFITLNDHEIGIIVGDVSGHGIEAALVMSMAKHILSIYIKLHRSLTETLCHANEEICSSLKGNSFVAVFVGILNTKTHVLRYARAGQAYPLIYNPERQENPYEIQSRGMVLGTGRGEMFKNRIEEKHVQLMSNDIVLIYSDGILEAPDAEGEEFSLEGVTKTVKELSNKSSEVINKELEKRALEHANNVRADDITVLCMKVGDIQIQTSPGGIIIEEDSTFGSDTFMVAQDFTFDEEVQYQMISAEEKYSELDKNLKTITAEKEELEEKCKELQQEIELANNDPDSLIQQLRGQLGVALELPKDLINENKLLHERMEEQKKDLNKLEVELNDFASNSEFLNNDRKSLKKQLEKNKELAKKCQENIQNFLLDEKLGLNEQVKECIRKFDYKTAYEQLHTLAQVAIAQNDVEAVQVWHKQILVMSQIIQENFSKLLDSYIKK